MANTRTIGSIKLPSNFEIEAGAPIDARLLVPTYADLTNSDNFPYSYVGMTVAVKATGKLYILKASPSTTASNWAEVGSTTDLSDYYNKSEVNALIASVYKPSGSVAYASLPALAANVLGNVYNINESFTTTSDFLDGAGKTYPANTNVVIVNIGTTESPTYKYDVLAGFVDLSTYQKVMQQTNLPTATAAIEGTIAQYIGATTSDYTNGYFYKCIEDPENTGSYIWAQCFVQDAGGSGSLENGITATKAVGGVEVGDSFAVGTSYEEVLNAILNPVFFPTFTAPSATLSVSPTTKLFEAGATPSVTFTLELNKGAITVNGVKQNDRSGGATQYNFDGSQSDSSNQFERTLSSSKTSYTGTINYAAGPQPKDSIGRNSGSALAAGSVTSNAINFEWVDAIWANTANINTVAKLALVSAAAKSKEFVFPAATTAHPETFDVPASWTITAVQFWDPITNGGQWSDASGEFAITSTSHDNAASVAVNYNRYTCSLPYDMQSRKIKVIWS